MQRAYADWPEFAPAWGTATGLYFTESLGWTTAEVNDLSLNIANLVAPCAGADSSMCRGFGQVPYVPGPLNCAASAGPNEDFMFCARGYAAHHWIPAGQNFSPLALCDPTGAHGCAPLWTCCPKDDPSDVCDVCPGGVVAPSAIGGGLCKDPVSNGAMGITMYPGCALCVQPGEENNKEHRAQVRGSWRGLESHHVRRPRHEPTILVSDRAHNTPGRDRSFDRQQRLLRGLTASIPAVHFYL